MTRRQALLAARIGFLLLTVGFAWWGFRGRWDEIGDALVATDPWRLLASVAATALGLAVTAFLWRRLLAGLGSTLPRRDAAAIFLVGQLGKYIPGSVWTFAVQAQLGRRHEVPARASVAASSVFLLLHTFTGVVLGAGLAAAGLLEVDGPRWLWAAVAVGAAALITPPVVRRIGARLAGRTTTFGFGPADLAIALGLMAAVWTAYGVGLALLVDHGDVDLVTATAAFALSHAAGVLLVFAPAGLGAREGVIIALLGPAVGLGPAAAVALLSRVVHSVADFLVAVVARASVGVAFAPVAPDAGVDRAARA